MERLSVIVRLVIKAVPKPDPVQPTGLFSKAGLIVGGTVMILLAGCGQPAPPTPGVSLRAETVALPTSAPTPEPSPINTRVMPLDSSTPEATPTITPIPDEARGLVVEVIDGQTIAVVLEGDPPGQAYVVRYIGINVPPNTPDNPWGVVAYETNRKMTNLKVVRLVRDETDFDDEGRLLRYVYVGDELMSIILAERGLAQAASTPPNTRFQAEIEQAEAQARAGQLGLWGPRPTPTPPRRQPTATGELDTPTPETSTTGTVTAEPQNPPETPTGTSSAGEAGQESTVIAETPTNTGETPAPPPEVNGTPENRSELQGPP